MIHPEEKLAIMHDNVVEQIVFDALHLKREWKVIQHSDYKRIYEELEKVYKQQIEKQTETNK